ncbi:MAG: LLM class F420-dependent oxidoreductase [Chloroflexi bacterium]|nr:LLM class F420-dependent oxidoreductase [Chloroflexota bacterium]
MKIGLQVFRFDWQGSPANIGQHFLEIARRADANGFASLWVMDHYFQMEMVGNPAEPMLEAYTALSFAAAATQNIRLGALVTGANYRHPGFLIKSVTTLDVLSGGRAYLGIGAGWYEREALGLGLPFPPLAERFERLEETLQIAHQMWSTEPVAAYAGAHYHLAEPINQPSAQSQPHPPILIGGGGEKKTLRMVAQYGDACNLFMQMGMDNLQHKLDVLKGHCDTVGRDYATIEKTTLGMVNLAEGAQAVIDTCRQLAGIGIEHAIFNLMDYTDLTQLDVFGKEIIPAVADL